MTATQEFINEYNLSQAKQNVIKFAEEKGWEISVEQKRLRFRKFFPKKGVKHQLELCPGGTMFCQIFEGKKIRLDLQGGIRSHAEMKQALDR